MYWYLVGNGVSANVVYTQGNEDVPERRVKATKAFFELYDVVMLDFLTEESRLIHLHNSIFEITIVKLSLDVESK